jgi:hypothetical protein
MAYRIATTWLFVLLALAPVAGRQDDPVAAARFSITVDGYEIASFSELAGISSSVEVPSLVLKRGRPARRTTSKRPSSLDMWSWHEAARTSGGREGRKSGTLVAYDRAGKPVARWNFTNAWPAKVSWGGPGGRDRQQVETVTIVCERIERVSR